MSTEIPRPLQTAMREAGFLDPRAGNPSLNQWSNESGVHTSTISRFIAGGTARQDNVKKMADALGVTISDLYAMTGRAESTPWHPPQGTERLTVRQRQALTELVLAFVEEKEGDGRGEATPLNQAAGSAAQEARDLTEHKKRLRAENQARLDSMPLDEVLGTAAFDPGRTSDLQDQDDDATKRGEEEQ